MPEMSGFEFLSIVRRRFPQIPVVVISGEYVPEGMIPGLLADVFLQKGGYTPGELFSEIRKLISQGPARAPLPKVPKAPLWIPRREVGYIVATCPECLRSFPVDNASSRTEVRTIECPACGTEVEYLVDAEVLERLRQNETTRPGTLSA
jgi:hypothetical protein